MLKDKNWRTKVEGSVRNIEFPLIINSDRKCHSIKSFPSYWAEKYDPTRTISFVQPTYKNVIPYPVLRLGRLINYLALKTSQGYLLLTNHYFPVNTRCSNRTCHHLEQHFSPSAAADHWQVSFLAPLSLNKW